jgi:hypothetical protein
LANYAAKLAVTLNLEALLIEISRSDEHWEKSFSAHSSNLVRTLYRGLLGREPEPEALANYAAKLAETLNLEALLIEISRSDEHWEKSFSSHSEDIVLAIYQGLLRRDADTTGLKEYSKSLVKTNNLTVVLAKILASKEFSDKFIQFWKESNQWPNPIHTYENPTLVFLHIEKTAGTSLQNMFLDSYNQKSVYHEHKDTLYRCSPSELSKYSVFLGHFNHDSLLFIPRKCLSVFTFVRRPKDRLYSLYHFWRAHEPGHASYGGAIKWANELDIEPFFLHEVTMKSSLWNHMTWVIMGQRQWKMWQTMLLAETDDRVVSEIIATRIRPDIRRRLNEFIFIGLQEKFDDSVKLLFRILQRPLPPVIRSDHTLEGLVKTDPFFKKIVEKQPMTSRLSAALDRLVQLDNIIYEESSQLFNECMSRYSEIIAPN